MRPRPASSSSAHRRPRWLLRMLWTYLNAPSQVAVDEAGMRKLFRMMLIPAVLKEGSV